jgi:prevent-host-death family protein
MESISMLEFRREAGSVLKRVRKGHAFVLTYRGTPVARLEPIPSTAISTDDPIYSLDEIASKHTGSLTNEEIDRIVYGK